VKSLGVSALTAHGNGVKHKKGMWTFLIFVMIVITGLSFAVFLGLSSAMTLFKIAIGVV
jgi:hypothetical protein